MVDRNREAWLTDYVSMLLPLIKQRTGKSLGEQSIKISVGFPSLGGRRAKNRRIGECWHHAGERKYHQIFIHPELIDPKQIGETIAHEVLHAVLEPGTGHRKPFSRAAKALGLEGKPTATTAGAELTERLNAIAEQLGPYPHEALSGFGGKKQTTRLLKVLCPMCQYVVRVTTKWLDEAGAPICPQCLISMEEAGAGEGIEMATPLFAVDQTIEYRVRPLPESVPADETPEQAIAREIRKRQQFDPRWSLRMNRRGQKFSWYVIDYGPSVIDGKSVLAAALNPAGEDPYPDWRMDPQTGDPEWAKAEEPLTPVFTPRLTRAENREDAIALLERLREADDPNEVYAELGLDDQQELSDDEDPFFEDEHETLDDEPYTEEELELYEENERRRQDAIRRVARHSVRKEVPLSERIAELDRLTGGGK